MEGVVTGAGGHVYISLKANGSERAVAAYEPTGDLRRTARLLLPGDRIRAYGGVRRGTSLHSPILNMEKFELRSKRVRRASILRGTYISSPRSNRHLTKPLIRYGRELSYGHEVIDGWLRPTPRLPPVPA